MPAFGNVIAKLQQLQPPTISSHNLPVLVTLSLSSIVESNVHHLVHANNNLIVYVPRHSDKISKKRGPESALLVTLNTEKVTMFSQAESAKCLHLQTL